MLVKNFIASNFDNRENQGAMDASALLDLSDLLAPAADGAAGPDPRADYSPQSGYYRLRDLRAEARAAEREADSNSNLETEALPKWRQVGDLATKVLEQSKDLEIAAWLTEALLRSEGLEGFAAGVRLMAGLVANYWDGLFPMPDEDGISTRVAPVTGLNGEGSDGALIQPLRKLILFETSDGTPVPYWQYRQSADVSVIGDSVVRQRRLDAGVQPFEEMEKQARAAAATVAAFRAAAVRSVDAWQALTGALEAKAGQDAPPTSRVRDLLNEMVEVAELYAGDEKLPDIAPPEGGAEIAAGTQAPARAASSGKGALETREDALKLLNEVADFFRRTEPQSPLAYVLNDAVRRARLSWPDLLVEMVPDPTTRFAIMSSLGIRPPSE